MSAPAPTATYDPPLPPTAIVVSTFDAFHAESAKYPEEMMQNLFGGYVILVDDEVKVATSDELTAEITKKLSGE